jgi:hypothetical protein
MKTVFTKAWLFDALERAVKTALQVVVVLLGQDKVFDVFEVDWAEILGTAGGAALLSLVTSVLSTNFAGMSPASIVSTPPPAPPDPPKE